MVFLKKNYHKKYQNQISSFLQVFVLKILNRQTYLSTRIDRDLSEKKDRPIKLESLYCILSLVLF